MWLLAGIEEMADLPMGPVDPWTIWLVQLSASAVSLAYFLFLIWMLVHCYRTEPDRSFWIMIMFFAPGIGPFAYLILRYLPSMEFPAPAFLRKWRRGRELVRLEIAAQQIGNPHQFVQWGDALREVGRLDQARQAYDSALQKDPKQIQALWGAAQVAVGQQRHDDVCKLTRQILDQDPQYKFGDVSLAHGRALCELGQIDAARTHFEQHAKRWRHPEGLYLLARICADQGDTSTARNYLTSMTQDIDASPLAIARKFGRWKSRARQLLRKLPN